jgi:hypothetical protein
MVDSTDPMLCIRYRIACGEAALLFEMVGFDHSWGREFVARVENQGEPILAEVISRMGDRDLEIVKEGVRDALAGTRPKWSCIATRCFSQDGRATSSLGGCIANLPRLVEAYYGLCAIVIRFDDDVQ